MGGNNREIINLKQSLAEMQQLNNTYLQTIHTKGEENLAQMQQMEDLSAIIRQKEAEQDEHIKQIDEVTNVNNDLRLKAQ